MPLRALGSDSDSWEIQRDITNLVTWTATNPAVTIIDPVAHTLTAGVVGQSTIHATLGAVSGALSFEVTNATVTSTEILQPPVGGTFSTAFRAPLIARAHLSDGRTISADRELQWTTSDAAIAHVNGEFLQFLRPGTVQVSAAFRAVTSSVSLTVSGEPLQSMPRSAGSPRTAEATRRTLRPGTFAAGEAVTSLARTTYQAVPGGWPAVRAWSPKSPEATAHHRTLGSTRATVAARSVRYPGVDVGIGRRALGPPHQAVTQNRAFRFIELAIVVSERLKIGFRDCDRVVDVGASRARRALTPAIGDQPGEQERQRKHDPCAGTPRVRAGASAQRERLGLQLDHGLASTTLPSPATAPHDSTSTSS